MPQVWCNGDWCDASAIKVSATDRGLLHGFGLFETLLAIDGRPVFVDRHLERLRASCDRLGWTVPDVDFASLSGEVLARNELTRGRARLRISLTAGSGPLHDRGAGEDRLLWISAYPAPEVPESITATVSPWRLNERSPLAGLKSGSYAEHLLALSAARAAGFDEALCFNTSGFLCEAATANVFLVTGGILFTPSLETGCLPGGTRAVVLEAAATMGMPVRECLLTDRDLRTAEEIFVTSSLRGVLPISRLDGRELAKRPFSDAFREEWRRASPAR
ncbi:MAG: aminotransferase class IV [Akkermansiaceae bacterium]|nr:aminotransferase class IV [Akkermansiaceae bacterium]